MPHMHAAVACNCVSFILSFLLCIFSECLRQKRNRRRHRMAKLGPNRLWCRGRRPRARATAKLFPSLTKICTAATCRRARRRIARHIRISLALGSRLQQPAALPKSVQQCMDLALSFPSLTRILYQVSLKGYIKK